MTNVAGFRIPLGFLLGIAIVVGLAGSAWNYYGVTPAQAAPAQGESAGAAAGTLQADVARLKDSLPPQSHPMVDVGYHAVNLWFAAGRKNWPLAGYYLNETRNRIAWAVRMNPTVKAQQTGQVIDLKGIVDGLDHGTFDAVKDSIDKQDSARFVASYKHMLEGCYACHKAVGRPYLRPMVPVTPQQPIINFDPHASWPE